MGQQELIKIFKKNKNKWFSTKELQVLLNQSNSTITNSLKPMTKYNEILVERRRENHYWRNFYKLRIPHKNYN